MGHTHGIIWTEELIKEKTLEVVRELRLSRMPSRSECEKYYHDCALANAISRRIGWYKLAEILQLQIKESETQFGKSQEVNAQEQLIAHGYEARQMPQNFPYDLLINDCLKIDVKASKLYKGKNGNFYSFNLEKPFCTCDIYMLYLKEDNDKLRDMLIIPSLFVATNTQISVGECTSKYYKFSNKWDYIKQYVDFMSNLTA